MGPPQDINTLRLEGAGPRLGDVDDDTGYLQNKDVGRGGVGSQRPVPGRIEFFSRDHGGFSNEQGALSADAFNVEPEFSFSSASGISADGGVTTAASVENETEGIGANEPNKGLGFRGEMRTASKDGGSVETKPYRAKRGDNLWDIAVKGGATGDQIFDAIDFMEKSRTNPGLRLQIGELLQVPAALQGLDPPQGVFTGTYIEERPDIQKVRIGTGPNELSPDDVRRYVKGIATFLSETEAYESNTFHVPVGDKFVHIGPGINLGQFNAEDVDELAKNIDDLELILKDAGFVENSEGWQLMLDGITLVDTPGNLEATDFANANKGFRLSFVQEVRLFAAMDRYKEKYLADTIEERSWKALGANLTNHLVDSGFRPVDENNQPIDVSSFASELLEKTRGTNRWGNFVGALAVFVTEHDGNWPSLMHGWDFKQTPIVLNELNWVSLGVLKDRSYHGRLDISALQKLHEGLVSGDSQRLVDAIGRLSRISTERRERLIAFVEEGGSALFEELPPWAYLLVENPQLLLKSREIAERNEQI